MGSDAPRRPLLVSADDTTGALESAAMIADAGWHATVVSRALPRDVDDLSPPASVVVDLRSRHEPPAIAAELLGDVARRVVVHKIDSTLRGNWPTEVMAAVAAGRRVLIVPSFPAAGRHCEGGVVTEHGVPVDRTQHARDPRSPVVTCRPATVIAGAVELASLHDVATWLGRGEAEVAVADAADDLALTQVVAAGLAHPEVLLVGTAAVVGAVARITAHVPDPPPRARAAEAIRPPALVVCGSMHPVSHLQVATLLESGAVAAGASGPMPGATPPAVSVLVPPAVPGADAALVATALATRAADLVRSLDIHTVVLVGGDTAEAFIGDRPVSVRASLDTGVALGEMRVDGRDLTVLAKPGAFGSAHTLVHLMHHLLDGSA